MVYDGKKVEKKKTVIHQKTRHTGVLRWESSLVASTHQKTHDTGVLS